MRSPLDQPVTPGTERDQAWMAPCAARPEQWDLEGGSSPPDWLVAVRACQSCPMLAECQRARLKLYPNAAHGPEGVIWAGVPYSPMGGHPLDTAGLRRLAATMRRRRISSPASEGWGSVSGS